MPTIQEIRDLWQNWPPGEELSPASRGAFVLMALAASDQYGAIDDDLQNMLRHVMTDIRHAYDLLQIEDPGFDVDDRAAARDYANEVAQMGAASNVFAKIDA